MNWKRLPPELWFCIFDHATHVPGTLVPEIYDYASLIGPIYTKTAHRGLREALLTKCALVRVCKQWWHFAVPYLYRSVYIGRARCLSPLSITLTRSVAGKSTVVSTRPLGEYTERLDIAIRDPTEIAGPELKHLSAVIECMACLTIASFTITGGRVGSGLPEAILDGLQTSAGSLRVLDWSPTGLALPVHKFVDLLAKCTRLQVFHCPMLFWSMEFQRPVIPPTVTTFRSHECIRLPTPKHAQNMDSNPMRLCEPLALQEIILNLRGNHHYWEELLVACGSQFISLHLHIPNAPLINIDAHLQLLLRTCPALRRLTLISDCYSVFVRPHLRLPPIPYLGLRALRAQSPKSDFKALFAFLGELRSSAPSLRVVQLLNENNVRCLLKTHTKLAVRLLRPFVDTDASFRVEDKTGVALTDRLKTQGCLLL